MSSLVHLLAVVCTKRKPRDREREGRLGNEIGRIHFTWWLVLPSLPLVFRSSLRFVLVRAGVCQLDNNNKIQTKLRLHEHDV